MPAHSGPRTPTDTTDAPSGRGRRRWLRIAAIGSFTFFLVKGLVWLGVVGAALFQIAN
jgi:uncharacterized iron-regulated membrane protein